MASITTRAGKGSPLSNAEVDANFTNLNAELLTKQAELGYTPANKAGDTFTGDVVINTKLSVGTTATASTNYRFGKGITGATSANAFVQNGNVQSDVTSTAVSFNSQANTAAAAFQLSNYFHYYAQQGTIGAGSSILSVAGFYADSTLLGGVNTYGFRGALTSAGGKWNLYMDGSAPNYLAGATIFNNAIGLGTASSPSYGTAGQVLTSAGAGAAPTWTTLTGALSFTGDVTGTGSTGSSTSLTLANSGVTAGVYGGNNAIPSITFDAKGRATSAGTVTPSGTWGISISGNAATATTLQTARTINGVSFNGSANITVADSTKLPLSGGTLTGIVTGSSAAVQSAITGVSAYNAPFTTGETNVGTTAGFVPAVGQKTVYTSGYRSHMVLGSYRTASSWGGGPFIAWGGNDSYTTEYWLFNQGGTITHSGGTTVLNSSNYTSYRGTQLVSPNGATVVAADSAMPDAGHSFIHTLGLGPSGNDGHILGMTWAGTTSSYGAQIWVDTDPNNRMAFRSRSSTGSWTGWNEVIHSSNYNSYAPTLTGGGASGTWGISITGNAATANSSPLLSGLGTYVWSASTLPASYSNGIQASFVQASNGFQSYGSVMTMNTYSGGGGALQMYVPYSPTYGGTGLQVRFGNYDVSSGNSWTSWKTLLASDNYSSYALPLSGGTLTGTVASTGFIGQLFGAASGAPDSWIWSVSPSNPTWGIYYNEGTPDAIEFKAAGSTTASITLDTGAASFGFLTVNADMRVGNGANASYIYMSDADHGERVIHNNSNQIGFLTQASGWGAYCDDSGNWTAVGNVTAYSDETLKKDWGALAVDFVERLAALKYGTYTRIDSGDRQAGASAQSVQELLPEVVTRNADGKLSLAYGNAALVSAIELAKRVVRLEAQIAKLIGD